MGKGALRAELVHERQRRILHHVGEHLDEFAPGGQRGDDGGHEPRFLDSWIGNDQHPPGAQRAKLRGNGVGSRDINPNIGLA